jgi:hypothetical protein
MKRYSPSTKRYIEVEQLDQESVDQPTKLSKAKRPQKQNYLHANMEDIIDGVESAGIVWLRLLQLHCMRKEKYLALGNEWLAEHGVDRFAKARALRSLEKRGLIQIMRSPRRSPLVHIIPRAKRRVRKSQQPVAN